MSTPLVSFVIPAFNEQALIGRCLKAITAEIANTKCTAEIIVVNNRSTDDTRRVVSLFPEVIIIDEPIRGLVQARQTGYLNATGKCLANIDADTIPPPGWLPKALSAFEQDPDLVALSGPLNYYDMSQLVRCYVFTFYIFAYLIYLAVRYVFNIGSILQGGNFVVRKQALDAAGGFNTAFQFYGEDTEIACRMSRFGSVKFSFSLTAFSSGRRLKTEGLLIVAIRYSLNYFWVLLFDTPFTLAWSDIRIQLNPEVRNAAFGPAQ